jgi:LuxR family transcriptional regulator, maltose regulon positive regulatory protein
MQSALLSTKLYVPPAQPEVVPRPRLIERLNEGLARRLTLISAPAGFGKTTLLSQWLDRCRPAIAYVSLDEGDNDLARFLSYVVAALGKADPRVGEAAVSALRVLPPQPVEAILTALINDAAEAERDSVLVLDDYHVVESPAVHKAVGYLLDHLPPRMHLVIATRADPPLPLARLRARGQLAELRAADLGFTLGETAEFLSQMPDLELSAEDVAALGARTEGWAVGLQLAALSMKGRQDQHGFIDAFSGSQEYVADYLADEVLGRQPESVRAFRLQTSILGRLTGPLCDAVTGQCEGQETLGQMVRANLFTVSLDGERRWYRYHRLFADLLRRRLEERQPDLVPELHRRASLWHETHGFPSEAVEHALLAGDPERATRLIEDTAEGTLSRGEVATIRRWIESLPEELVRARPALCGYHAWCLVQGGRSSEAIEARLELSQPGQASAVRSFISIYQGRLAGARALAQQALKALPQDTTFFGTLARWELEVCELADIDLATAASRLETFTSTGQMRDNSVFAVLAVSSLARMRMRQGQLHEAREIFERAIALASDPQGNPLPIVGASLIGQGSLCYEWNNLDEAERLVTRGIELATRWSEMEAIEGYLTLSRIRHIRGHPDDAEAVMESARRVARQFYTGTLSDLVIDLVLVDQWIAQGDVERAASWVEEHGLLAEVANHRAYLDGLSYMDYHLSHHRFLAVARLWLAQNRPEEGLQLLDSLLAVMTERGWRRNRREIELQCLRALALQATGRSDEALVALETALELAEPGGYVRTFVDLGRPMARLLHAAAARGIRPSYVGTLLAARPLPGDDSQDGQERRDAQDGVGVHPSHPEHPVNHVPTAGIGHPAPIIEPLSQRELEVLGLMASGMTDREIAERLVLSPQTVKVHARNIYDKLEVGNRTQAAARGRTLGLLGE